jgi:hypothetical protein
MSADSDNHISFSRNLNLLIENDLVTFMQESNRAGVSIPVTTEKELWELIGFGRQFFPDSAFTISGGLTPIYVRPNQAVGYSFIGVILPLVSFLYKFRENTDFSNKIKVNLSNLAQFNDTVFELRCLKQFCENGYHFQYEPSVIVGDMQKRPDFKLTKGNLDVFVECEQVRLGQGKAEVQFTEQCNYVIGKFPDGLDKRLHSENLRLEVNFKETPSKKDLNTLVIKVCDVCGEGKRVCELPIQQVGESIEYTIIRQGEPSKFPVKAMRVGRLIVGTEPRRILNPDINSPEGEILFTSTNLVRRRRQTLVKRIREAKKQLPDSELGVIVLGKASLAIARQDIEKRMNGDQYQNIIASIVNPFEEFWSCYRTYHRELLFDLFEGFQPQNPFKQTE